MLTVGRPEQDFSSVEQVLERPAKKRIRLSFLDGVRGLSAMIVVIYHLGQVCSSQLEDFSHEVLNLGNLGVMAFFLVSGFVIPMSLERYNSLPKFWRGRLVRLYPLYWVSLFLVIALSALHLYPSNAGFADHLIRNSLVNLTMLQEFVRVPDALSVYWTLALEMVFYVFCSIMFWRGWLAHSTNIALLCSGTLLLADLLAAFRFHRSLPVGHASLLIAATIGIVAYKVHREQKPLSDLILVNIVFVPILLHGLWCRFSLYPTAGQTEAGSFTAYALSSLGAFAIFFIFFFFRANALPTWLTSLGKLTYSLYLLHELVVRMLPLFNPRPVWFCVALGLSVLLAMFTYRFVERPMMGHA